MFTWDLTGEGIDYWSKIYTDLSNLRYSNYILEEYLGKTTKPIGEYLELLQEPYKQKALLYASLSSSLLFPVSSLSNALQSAFNWAKTQEGSEYWNKIEIAVSTDVIDKDHPSLIVNVELLNNKTYCLRSS